MLLAERLERVIGELNSAADATLTEFRPLSLEQLNWKPAEKTWSVAQCLDHIIVTHSLYFPLFERLAKGAPAMSFWEKHSPMSGFFGRFLIKSLDPANLKPMKTTRKAYPSSSHIDGGIVWRYVEHQQQMVDALEKLPPDLALDTIVTSPLMGFVTYGLGDALTFIPMHCRRHFNQAKRVTQTDGFPDQGGI